MNISKLKALWALTTGGWSGLAVYLLEAVNGWLKNLDQTRLARFAEIVRAMARVMQILADTFLPSKYRMAANATFDALDGLAVALADGQITQAELDANIDAIEAAIDAWKAVK